MEFLDLINIAGQAMELENPTSVAKIVTAGKYLGLREGSRVLDFGCGFAEPLVIWAEEFGITAVGVEVREYACTRARRKVAARGLADRIDIIRA
ncbi:MAG TPA: class I SAM-dependent methyltransferase, partial [Caldilinea sp.]|nr:class I SAM-dependent methyltransferase [Caldilinea sp.]